jgi:hypothetical protein
MHGPNDPDSATVVHRVDYLFMDAQQSFILFLRFCSRRYADNELEEIYVPAQHSERPFTLHNISAV